MKKVLYIIAFLLPVILNAQVSSGGHPLSSFLNYDLENYQMIEIQAPERDILISEDDRNADTPGPYRIGVHLAADIDLDRDGMTIISGQSRITRVGIKARGAMGLILYYDAFDIPDGAELFIYGKDKKQIIGAFTHKNNPYGGYFATEMIKGDELVIEYNDKTGNAGLPRIKINEISFVYRDVYDDLRKNSGDCEVNINCPEGDNWQNEKKSVAKILLKDGSGSFLCTGTLVNNVRQDSTPYFLTARHCGSSATTAHYTQWIFYFCYEAQTCENPVVDPPCGSMVGCELLAQAPEGTSNGSDFKLLRFEHQVPEAFNPWFSGWNANGAGSSVGVCIHHPQGDIKKISTYTEALTSVNYSGSTPNPDGDFWRVVWSATTSGHGVTEGGSSGAPLFDNTGKIVGTLTGGAASCSNLGAPDYYGKFSSHWSQNGNTADKRLEPWLDPDNSGAMSVDGFGYGNVLTSNFSSDTNVVSVGGRVQFMDNSTGAPEVWRWTFYGGSPSNYEGQQPGLITYYQYGEYHVSLVINNHELSDSLLRRKYIRVTPNVYPIPAYDYIIIDFGNRPIQFVDITIYDMSGQLYRQYYTENISSGIWKLSLDDVTAGNYIMQIKTDVMEDYVKLPVY